MSSGVTPESEPCPLQSALRTLAKSGFVRSNLCHFPKLPARSAKLWTHDNPHPPKENHFREMREAGVELRTYSALEPETQTLQNRPQERTGMNEPKPDLATHERLLKGAPAQSSGNANAAGAVSVAARAPGGSGAVGPGRGEAADQGARLCQKSGRPTVDPETGGRTRRAAPSATCSENPSKTRAQKQRKNAVLSGAFSCSETTEFQNTSQPGSTLR